MSVTDTPRAPWLRSTEVGPTARTHSGALAGVRGELVWVLALTLLVVGLTLVPPTLARLIGPADRVHVGTYWYHEDFPVYLAAMQEAASTASWLIHDHFTTESHGPIMMFPLYVLIGKVSAYTGLPLLAVYAAVELIARCVLASAIYAFVAALVANRAGRRFAFLLSVFGAGLGFWTALLHALSSGPGAENSARLINLYVEATTFGAFLTAPHISLGLAAILVGLLAYTAACQGSRLAVLAVAGCVLVLGLVHPFNMPVLLLSFGVYAVARAVIERRLPWPAIWTTAVAGAVGAPIVIYNYVAFTFTPVWSQTFGTQNLLPSPRPWELLTDYGLGLGLAVLGIISLRGRTTVPQRVVLTWLAVIAVCIYLPVPYQRRFGFGAQPALAGLAAIGWPIAISFVAALLGRLNVADRLRFGIAQRILGYSVVPLAFTTVLTGYFVVLSSAVTGQPLHYYAVDRDTYAVAEWIAQHSGPDDVSIGSFETGAALGGMVPGRVYAGHVGVTIGAAEKQAEIAALYRGEMSDEETRLFLRSNDIRYLVTGPEERKLGPVDPGERLGLPVATRSGSAVVYQTDME